METNYEELVKLKHLKIKKEDLKDRFIPLFVLYDKDWTLFTKTEKGFVNIKIIDMTDGFYFSKEAIQHTDIKLEFFNLMYKKNNFKENFVSIYHIFDDIQNLLASAEKINFFSKLNKKEDNYKLCKYASVELESIFQNSRAIFENLQKIQTNLIKTTIAVDGSNLFSINEIQFGYKSNKVEGKQTLSKVEYMEKYKIPELLANFYVDFQEFFFFILSNRNDVFHSRKTFSLFLGEEGFSISLNKYDLNNLDIWNKNNVLENKLGSLKSLIAYIILNTVYALEKYAITINKIIQLPDDIVPDYNLYLRSEFNQVFQELNKYLDLHAWKE